jgi:uncharacterized protein DUF5317
MERRAEAALPNAGRQTEDVGLTVLVLLVAAGVGRLFGGGWDGLSRVPLRSPGLLVAAFAGQLLGSTLGRVVEMAYPVTLVLSAVLAAVFLGLNLRLPGMPLVGLGLACNALVVALNGAMPVSTSAAARAGVELSPTAAASTLANDLRHEPRDAATRVAWLGDVVPVALPGRPEVDSPGDLLAAAGLALLVLSGLTAGSRRTAQPPEVPARSTTRESDSTTRGSYS